MISIADILVVAHSWAYRTGRHAVAIDITRRLNAARGLQPRRSDDRRCDTQFVRQTEILRVRPWRALSVVR
jgi:hypothetical protein